MGGGSGDGPSRCIRLRTIREIWSPSTISALMHALVRFAHIAAGDTFTTRDLHPTAVAALDVGPDEYRLASLRYDLSKLRAKRLVENVPHSRRYRLLPEGYRICVLSSELKTQNS